MLKDENVNLLEKVCYDLARILMNSVNMESTTYFIVYGTCNNTLFSIFSSG
jgi:hypothetical protein